MPLFLSSGLGKKRGAICGHGLLSSDSLCGGSGRHLWQPHCASNRQSEIMCILVYHIILRLSRGETVPRTSFLCRLPVRLTGHQGEYRRLRGRLTRGRRRRGPARKSPADYAAVSDSRRIAVCAEYQQHRRNGEPVPGSKPWIDG
jgi:hypothetical protein